MSYFYSVIAKEPLPTGWVVAIADRAGIFVTRTQAHDAYEGKPTSSDFRSRQLGDEGFYYGRNVAGDAVLVGYAHSALTGWIASANIVAERVSEPLRRSVLLLIGWGLPLLALAVLSALLLGRRIDHAMRSLHQAAAAMGRHEKIAPVESSIREVDEVGFALSAASLQMQHRDLERDEAEASLRQTEGRLRNSEARLRQVLASTSDSAIITSDLAGVITGWNVGAHNLFGWDEDHAVGKPLEIVFTPEDRVAGRAASAMGTALSKGKSLSDHWYVRRNGSRFHGSGALHPLREENGSVIGFVKILRDHTEQEQAAETIRELNASLTARVIERTSELESANERLVAEAAGRERAENQLRQAQKMEAVGRLTGGIAHDFNNLLTIITGSLETLRRRLDAAADDRVRRLIGNAIDGANRAAALTHRLLAFSRQQPLAPEPVDANKLLAGMSDLFRRTLGADVAMETVLAGGLWRTHADPNQLENALLNLAVNARDAMPDGGKLTIESSNTHLDDDYVSTRSDVSAGQYVMIAVCDTGSGMTADVLAKVFEPFFTTKPVGKGTGLGMSQVYGFVKQSHGHVSVYSEVGHGTTVKLYLPRFQQNFEHSLERATTSRAQSAPMLASARPGETILVVEDDAMVREFSISTLEDAGYHVLGAEDGPSGLALLDAHPEITFLFTDVVLTGPMNGRKVADEARRRRPSLKVLFTTGYTRNAIIHHGRLDEGVDFIGKPFTATKLTYKIRAVIDADHKNGGE